MNDIPLIFACEGEPLVGVLSRPTGTARTVGVLIVAGAPQYRSGSHRQFVLLARALAEAGYPALRFDYRGMGDADGEARSFEAVDVDVRAAIDAMLTAAPGIERVVLWGLCDGASAALLYALRSRDARVAGLALANPWLQSEQAQAHAIVHTYYRQRFLEPAFWRKLLGGRINPWRKLRELGGHWRTARAEAKTSHAASMLDALDRVRLPMLLLLCDRDATAQAFLAQVKLAGCPLLQQGNVKRADFAEADHTFSRAEWRRDAENVTIGWLNGFFPT